MTNKNNGRIVGKNHQKINLTRSVKKRDLGNASYVLVPITGKSKMRKEASLMQSARHLKASTFIKALRPLLFVTYRFTCEKLSYYSCAMRHVLNWVYGDASNMVIDYSKVLVASGN